MPDPMTTDDVQAALIKEYGQYVAVRRIDINGVRAFNVGDRVPASHVTGGVVAESQVSKVTTKAGQAAVQSATQTTEK